MLERLAEPGRYQERAELVAVQGGGVRLVVHPRTADVGGRGMLQELFFDGVLVAAARSVACPPGSGLPSAV